MIKKIFKTILTIIIILLFILFFFAVIKPAYIQYKQNQPQVTVDKSGERATSKDKEKDKDKDNKKEIESEEFEYNPFTFDDRILLYEGNIDAEAMTRLINVLIEDIDNQMYSKVDVNINGTEISYENEENYTNVLKDFRNSISANGKYFVEFEYSTLNAVVDKVIIKSL